MDRLALGIDIGGTKTAVGVVDEQGRVVASRVAATPAGSGAAAVLAAAGDLASALLSSAPLASALLSSAALASGALASAQPSSAEPSSAALADGGWPVLAVGVGAPGVVDPRRGVVVSATDLLAGWAGTPVAAILGARLGLPVVVDNDVRAAGLGEARHGAGAGVPSALVVAVGTGIGGALIRDGALVPGASGVAGHLGHLPVPDAGPERCSCGRPDHLEVAAAGPAIVRAARAAGLPVADTAEVVRLAATDQRARAVLAHAATVLGRMLGGLVNLLDPDVVVIGGGVAGAGEAWWAPLRSAFAAELLRPAAPRLVPAALGTQAGMIGAAAMARTAAERGII
jgi:glucokinase